MKAILEFNLPDDEYDYTCARNGAHYRRALVEIGEYLREQRKYAQLTAEQAKLLERIDAAFVDALDGIDLYE